MSKKIETLNIETLLKKIKEDLGLINSFFNKEEVKYQIDNYEKELGQSNFWQETDQKKEILKNYNTLKNDFDNITSLNEKYDDLITFYEISINDNDQNMLENCLEEANKLEKIVSIEKLKCLFDKEIYKKSIYLEIHAGSGGVDAQDFASMLLRMYIRWAEKNKFRVKEIESTKSDIAGIKSTTLQISGLYAYGNFISEVGIHRLVRISPFNSEGKRQTGFCAVSIYPEVTNKSDIKIETKDLRIDTYRAAGSGGQHVNTTDSAVRITHIPTGVVAQSQVDRSQHKNKEIAMSLLFSKINQLELEKKKLEKQKNYNSRKDIDFSSQIRSYVLNPYSMVKDHRTKYESSNPKDIFDGELYNFVLSYLQFIKD